jgi:hypothetical protein
VQLIFSLEGFDSKMEQLDLFVKDRDEDGKELYSEE